MNRQLGKIIAAVVLAASPTPFAALAASTDEAQIRALEARYAKAVAAKDLDALMAVYAPDVFVFDLIPPRQYVGVAAYREDWKQAFAGIAGPFTFEVTDLVVATDGKIGYGHSVQHTTGTDPKGNKVDLTIRFTDVYRKQAGAWLIVQEHASIPVDLATGKPDFASKP